MHYALCPYVLHASFPALRKMEISFKRAGFTWKVVHFPVTDNETVSQTGVTPTVTLAKVP